MGSFRQSRVEELPNWLADDEVGRPYQEVLGAGQDTELRKLKDAVLATFTPSAPDDALPLLERDLLIEQAPGEANADFRVRLTAAVDITYWWGTKKAYKDLLEPLGIDPADVVVLNNYETSFGEQAEPWWSCVWPLIDSTAGPWEPDAWDAPGDVWDASGDMWDLSMTTFEAEYIKRTIRRSKSPGAYPAFMFVAIRGEVWDLSGDVWDLAGDRWDDPLQVTAERNLETINATGHGFVDDDGVVFTATIALPDPLVAETVYYVVNATANSFQLALTEGGSVIDLTTNEVGLLYAVHSPPLLAVVPIRIWPLWDDETEILGEGIPIWDDGGFWDEGM